MAGGRGSRLGPVTDSVSKQLLPIYDKPLIFYSLSILFLAGIRDINIVCMKRDLEAYSTLFGTGERFGADITYIIQNEPKGIAEGILLSEDRIKGNKIAMILGDNFFWGQSFIDQLQNARSKINPGAHVFGYKVNNPESFGVLELDLEEKVISLEEKPREPKSNIACTGLYFYDETAVERVKDLKYSERGELEITDLNLSYLKDNLLTCTELGRGFAWLDTGSTKALHDASIFVESIENRQGLKIACLEEIALTNKWIDTNSLARTIGTMANSDYKSYLEKLLEKKKF